ncbi:MAG: FAD-dependent oxidoreductase [Deltaproteobacteria bacterium]|nr:FAD-dependent oxidoreductase [Deltaproteobacteria bacterium]
MSGHVVVIGGGVAGCTAAVKASRDGARVTLVRRGVGSTALSTGAVSLDGVEGDLAGVELLESMVPLKSTGAKPGRFLVSSGAVLVAARVGSNHLAGALDDLEGKSVLVCGVTGFPAMNAADIARRLGSMKVKAEARVVQVPGLKRSFDLTAFPLAHALDDPTIAAGLAAAVKDEVGKGSFDAVALPPVMGLDGWQEMRGILDGVLGMPWFELLSVPPSVPGMRLHRSLMTSLGENGVTVLKADVKHATIKGDAVVEVRAWDGEQVHVLEPDEVVLATGRFVGGGITLEEGGRETLLGIDVPVAGQGWQEEHLDAGVATDGDLRPVDAQGKVVFSNVRAAGAVRQGGAYSRGKGGMGIAAVLGHRAGMLAAAARRSDRTGALRTVEALPRAGQEGCLGCEVCSSVCPVLGESARVGTWYPGPRGLGGLSRSGPLLEAAGDQVALCTLCGACSSMCPVGASNHDTVAALRARILDEYPESAPEAHRALPAVLAEHGNVYGTTLEPLEGPRRTDAEIAFFPGCSLSYFERESAAGTIKLFEALGVPFSLVDGVCCGGPLDVLGQDVPAEAVEKNREAVKKTGARVVMATCPRCAHRLSHDLDLEGVRVEHTLETLDRILADSPALERIREKLGGRVVTYHDPCELGRYRGLYENARRVLELAGVRLVEMARARDRSACCGAGGGLRSVNPKLSREISRRRVAEAIDTGADILLTECPSCLHNLRTGKKRKQKIEVDDVTALLGGAL